MVAIGECMDGANQKRFGVTRRGPRRTLRAGLPILQGGPPSPGQGHIACKPLRQLLGERFVRAYTAVKDKEHQTYLRVISSWEREFLLFAV